MISISITIFGPIVAVAFTAIMNEVDISILYVIEKYIMCFDVWTNFWCVILTYNTFNKLYIKLFGKCCHNKCQLLWNKCVGNNKDIIMVNKELSMTQKSNSSHGTISTNTNTNTITPKTNTLPVQLPSFNDIPSLESVPTGTATMTPQPSNSPEIVIMTKGKTNLEMVQSQSDNRDAV